MSAGATVSSEGLSGTGGSILTTAWFWLLARGSLSRRASLEGSLSVPTIWQLASPRVSNPREQGGSGNAFHDLASEVTHHHFCSTLLATQPALMQGRCSGSGNHQEAAYLTMHSAAHLQFFVQPLLSKCSSIHPSAQQTFPHSFLSSASFSPGTSPWPNTG